MKWIPLWLWAMLCFSGHLASQGVSPDFQNTLQPQRGPSGQVTGVRTVGPPPFPVRNPAEWEEMDAILIGWKSYSQVLTEIVRYAREECKVYILSTDSASVKSTLQGAGVSLEGVFFMDIALNSVWIRDYGPNSAYRQPGDSLVFVDWVYNRPRPLDDASSVEVGNRLGIPVYEATQSPAKLIATGGNYFSDGLGNAFSSHLITDENPDLTSSQIDQVQSDFLGINRYIRFPTLPYDGIHHIDMHMKLLNEETLLVGEFPDGVADEPQIESNLAYLSTFTSCFGTPYKIVRIPMVPNSSGVYADQGAAYRTYSNSLIINKTVLVPTYYESYDTIGLRIYREHMPGYNVIGINCQQTIGASGAIHCITHEVATSDPLLISHQPLPDFEYSAPGYPVSARISHRTGIQTAQVRFRTDSLQSFSTIEMVLSDSFSDTWTTTIPVQPPESRVEYYISATATSGKSQMRPITAPEGFWNFQVGPGPSQTRIQTPEQLNFEAWVSTQGTLSILPEFTGNMVSLELFELTGRVIWSTQSLRFTSSTLLSLSIPPLNQGIYLVRITAGQSSGTNKIYIR